VSDLAASAFLASTHSVKEWTDLLLLSSITATLEDGINQARLHRISIAPGLTPPGTLFTQRAWDEPACKMRFTYLLEAADDRDRARLLACSTALSGSWLHALLSANLGLRLGNQENQISIGLRLGSPVVLNHVCVCGVHVLPNGHYGLPCRRSAGRNTRHTAINGILAQEFASADVSNSP